MFKKSIVSIDAYHPQQNPCAIILDANESYVNAPYNRYPDPVAGALRGEIANLQSVSPDEIIVGNGSSELIDLVMKCTLSPGDQVLTFGPTFSIYELNATILGAETRTYALDENFKLNIDGFIERMKELQAKLVILCNPNNPTGTLLTADEIVKVLEASSSIVIVDEAYIEFGGQSVISLINRYPQLVVLRTLSKAYGLAGVRVGYMVSCKSNVQVVNKVRPPYNLSVVAQEIALEALSKGQELQGAIEDIKVAREHIKAFLAPKVRVYPSGGNFIFFYTDKETLFEELLAKGIRIRKYSGNLKGYFRITIGSAEENTSFVQAMEAIYE